MGRGGKSKLTDVSDDVHVTCCSSCCCSCCVSCREDGNQIWSINLSQIIVICFATLFTEGGLAYLRHNDLDASLCLSGFHRILLWVSLLSTSILAFVTRNKLNRENVHQNGGGMTKSKEAIKLLRSTGFKLQMANIIHSVILCGLFLLCSLFLLTTIPDDFHRTEEVLIKIVTLLFDMALTLLFAKSSIQWYFEYTSLLHPRVGDKEQLTDEHYVPVAKTTTKKVNNTYHQYTMLE